MKTFILLIVCLMIATGTANAGDWTTGYAQVSDLTATTRSSVLVDRSKWTTQDTVLQTAVVAITVADWSQTLQIARNPRQYEEVGIASRFIGTHPSERDVNLYFAASIIFDTVVAVYLDKPYRTIWQGLYISYEYSTVQHNREIGLGVSIGF